MSSPRLFAIIPTVDLESCHKATFEKVSTYFPRKTTQNKQRMRKKYLNMFFVLNIDFPALVYDV